MDIYTVHINNIKLYTCFDLVVFLELFRPCGIFGTVPTVWYFLFFTFYLIPRLKDNDKYLVYNLILFMCTVRNRSKNTTRSEQFQKYHKVGTVPRIPQGRNSSKNTTRSTYPEIEGTFLIAKNGFRLLFPWDKGGFRSPVTRIRNAFRLLFPCDKDGFRSPVARIRNAFRLFFLWDKEIFRSPVTRIKNEFRLLFPSNLNPFFAMRKA
jgi:hypothetical protein